MQNNFKTNAEALELPGKLSDYHFAIQNCHNSLKGFAREEPWVLEEVERLCWLDIRLISEYPEIITPEPINIADEELAKIATARRGERRFATVLAFQQLISMYDREGYLREALEVAKIAERFEQCSGKVEEIIGRLDRDRCGSKHSMSTVLYEEGYRTIHSLNMLFYVGSLHPQCALRSKVA